jgi:hypothetical protein
MHDAVSIELTLEVVDKPVHDAQQGLNRGGEYEDPAPATMAAALAVSAANGVSLK